MESNELRRILEEARDALKAVDGLWAREDKEDWSDRINRIEGEFRIDVEPEISGIDEAIAELAPAGFGEPEDDPKGEPFLAVGNEEIRNQPEAPEEGSPVWCDWCGREHPLQLGEKVNDDGTKEKTRTLGFVHCDVLGKSRLVAVNGKLLKWAVRP